MNGDFVSVVSLPEFSLLGKKRKGDSLVAFELELTARCNNECRHCYINLMENDVQARRKELSFGQITHIIDQSASLGVLWCMITGGEPLLRKDFFDIYLYLKKKGILISVFTNATLITDAHAKIFKQYPPRDIEVTVYGVTKDTYERVTRKPGSFSTFMHGLNLLLHNGIKVRLKTIAMRSNVQELPEIARFCRKMTKDYFRFDPLLCLRLDANQERNEEIKSERLAAQEIAAIEQADFERAFILKNNSDKFINEKPRYPNSNYLFNCGVGNGNFYVSYDGYFKLCCFLSRPDCRYDLKKGNLRKAYEKLALKIRNKSSNRKEFIQRCHVCSMINLCLWCPAHSALETGELDRPLKYFCTVAHARRKAILKAQNGAQ